MSQMKLFRVRISPKRLSIELGFIPSCLVKVREGAGRGRFMELLRGAFDDDVGPIMGLIEAGDYTVDPIDLTTEGIA